MLVGSLLIMCLCWYLFAGNLAKTPLERSKLPVPEEFSKALYTFDIGQNDLSVGFRKMNFDQIRESMPDIVNQLANAVKVSTHLVHLKRTSNWLKMTLCFDDSFLKKQESKMNFEVKINLWVEF